MELHDEFEDMNSQIQQILFTSTNTWPFPLGQRLWHHALISCFDLKGFNFAHHNLPSTPAKRCLHIVSE